MAKTSTDARKHLREWSKFFAVSGKLTESLVKEFISRYKKHKYLRQSLERLINRGFVARRGSALVVTDSGRRFFRKTFQSPLPASRQRWDGKWRLITFDVPGNYNPRRNRLRSLLKEYNFYPLQKSVWICPDYLAEGFWQELLKENLDQYCRAMVVEFIEGDEDLRKNFKLPVK